MVPKWRADQLEAHDSFAKSKKALMSGEGSGVAPELIANASSLFWNIAWHAANSAAEELEGGLEDEDEEDDKEKEVCGCVLVFLGFSLRPL